MADEQYSVQSSAASAQAYVDSLAAALNAASMTQGPQSTASLASLSQAAAAAAATGNTLASPLLSINPRGTSTTSDAGSAAAAMLAAGTPGLITGLPAVAVPGMVPAAVPVAAVPGAAGAAAVPSVLPAVNAAVLAPGMGTVMPAAALVPPAVPAVSALSATAVTPAAPTIVPPTPAALAVLEAATALDAAESMVRAAVNQAASVAAAEEVTDAQAADAAEAAMAAAPAGTATTEAAAEPETPDSNAVLASPIGSASADALAAAMAASAQAQQQEQLQAQQAQIQQIMAQQNLQQQIANQQNLQQQIANQQFAQQQQQQQAAMMAMSPPSSSASAFSDLSAAGFPAAAAAYAAQQQQQIQQQQQQLQQQQQMMAAAGMTTATALVPTGATPAQVAAGMPSVQAVSVLVPSGQGSSQAMSQMSQPLVSQMMGTGSMSGKTLGGSSAATLASQQVALSQAIAASNASLLSATPSAAGDSSATSTCSQLSNALTKLAIAQHQQQQAQQFQQQQAQQLQQQVAANVMLQAAASSASSSNLLPSIASGMSLSNLKSTSVASSVMSGVQPMSQLEPIPSTAPASGAGASGAKVRVLLSSGGEYEEVAASEGGTGGRSTRWRYVGGETRLVGLKRTHSYSGFLQQLSKATSAVWDESCRLMYDLPSGEADVSGTLVDLIDDEDLEMMWEELDVMLAIKPNFRLHIYVQLGTRRSSTGQATSSIASEEPMSDHLSGSTPKSQAVAAATAAAAAVGSSSSNSAAETPRHPDGQHSSGSNRGAAEPAGPGAAGVGGSANVTNNTNNTAVTFTSSEYDDLVEDIVSDKPQLNLSDLEAKLDIISPEDLTPVRLLGSGGFGEVYLCRWHSCEVAVKCLNPSLLVPDGGMGSISKDNVSELLKEANMLGSVRHPNIVWVYGLVLPPLDAAIEAVKQGLAPGQGIDAVKVTMQMANKHRAETPISALRPPALVTEYLASGSLRAAITRKAEFVTKDSVKIKLALDAARGMEYLHGKNIVHFDLKTANLLVGMRDKTPICKVADFGLSKQKQQTYVTGVATLRGTLPWIAPEIIKTPGTVTEAVDVYSFGVVLWELWTLREPFEGINYHALLHMMSTSTEAVRPPLPGGPDFEGEAGPEPAPGWHELIRDCWMDDPSLRPSFKQLVSRLELMLRQQRMAKKRSASGPAGTGCATSTPVSQG